MVEITSEKANIVIRNIRQLTHLLNDLCPVCKRYCLGAFARNRTDIDKVANEIEAILKDRICTSCKDRMNARIRSVLNG